MPGSPGKKLIRTSAFLENSRSQNPALVTDPRNVAQGVERLIFEANTPCLDAENPRLRWLEVRG